MPVQVASDGVSPSLNFFEAAAVADSERQRPESFDDLNPSVDLLGDIEWSRPDSLPAPPTGRQSRLMVGSSRQ